VKWRAGVKQSYMICESQGAAPLKTIQDIRKVVRGLVGNWLRATDYTGRGSGRDAKTLSVRLTCEPRQRLEE
jgi:hypothetical protein